MYRELQLAEKYVPSMLPILLRGNYVLEPKHDGFRGEPTSEGIFSRYQNKWKFSLKITELIDFINKLGFNIDGEFDSNFTDVTGKLLPHQERRLKTQSILTKGNISDASLKHLVFYAFDIVPLKNEHNLPLHQRVELLDKVIPMLQKVAPFTIMTNPRHVITSEIELIKWFKYYTENGFEGIMLKNFNQLYLYGIRNFNWLKWKLRHTSDLPILRIEAGEKGKKNEFRMGKVIVKTPKGEAAIGTGYKDNKGKYSRDFFWQYRNELTGSVMEIEHEGYSNETGGLLNASFIMLRTDKPKWELSF